MLLFYRDALDCVEYLFGNPVFADKIDFCPVQLYHNSEQTICMYTKWMTGNVAWEMQARSCSFSPNIVLHHLTLPLGNPSRWCNPPRCYPLLRQDKYICDDR